MNGLCLCAAFLAGSLALPVAAETPKPVKDPNRKICKADVKTGSRVGQRTCRTAAEWEAQWKAGSQQARQMIESIPSTGTKNN